MKTKVLAWMKPSFTPTKNVTRRTHPFLPIFLFHNLRQIHMSSIFYPLDTKYQVNRRSEDTFQKFMKSTLTYHEWMVCCVGLRRVICSEVKRLMMRRGRCILTPLVTHIVRDTVCGDWRGLQ